MKYKKTLIAISVAASAFFVPISAYAGGDAQARLLELYQALGESGAEEYQNIEDDITDIWNTSGSAAMTLLLNRGARAMASNELTKAVEHYSALIDHAPDFTEGWNARATAFFMMDEYGMALADIRQVLVQNPNHFGALAGLGLINEILDNPDAALRAYLAAQAIHPHIDTVNESIIRLREARIGAVL